MKGLDYKLLQQPSKATTYQTWLLANKQRAIKEKNFETSMFLKEMYEKYKELEKPIKISIGSWKSKSSIKLIENDKGWNVTTWQRPSPNEKPKRFVFKYSKKEIRAFKTAINITKKQLGNEFKSRDLVPNYYKIMDIRYTDKNKPLFYKGIFDWSPFFNWRMAHCRYTILMRILRQKKLIEYSGGRIKILQQIR